ncbi:N(4)-(beta-N-acetylglucosaminyl)-L-asparaginase [Lactococcus raffinolactis]|uniref:N(4)-(beta-N-acetylglucosaminyl)-L-asparaginase n=1 Tax=Pseudolactococcus raffinolactis TaxID=1366 RepID=UPI001C70A604|nr:N(4)-(beta-N-acetylglucosaminyl)-L-asparaginase [Lactococcus raffinolactis]MBW9297593.1 N(4)-(beta-N-acetylglucosaminyl)-L-asparaginase [Lactococcus raffinolactis]
MTYGIIATWAMAFEGISNAAKDLAKNGTIADNIEATIKKVEDFPFYKSVGYGGLPNEEMIVELDVGFMDGDNLDIGAVAGIQDFANPVSIARALSTEKLNNVLVAEGAAKYAQKMGFERKNMLTDRAMIHYKNRLKENSQGSESGIVPYRGHDTVGVVGVDMTGSIVSGTSTSGLFMKRAGRVGDSPIAGGGFYADSEVGAASATGLGEDLMKGCISYEIVRSMREGLSPQEACEQAVNELEARLIKRKGIAGDLSVVAIDKNGDYGCVTNIDNFSFVVATDKIEPTVFIANRFAGKTVHKKASMAWLENYMQTRTAPLIEK